MDDDAGLSRPDWRRDDRRGNAVVSVREDKATSADVESVAKWLAENGLPSWTWDNIPRKPTMSRPGKEEFRAKATDLLARIFKEGEGRG